MFYECNDILKGENVKVIRINQEKMHSVLICLIIGFEIIKNGLLNLIRMFGIAPWHVDTIVVYAAFVLVAMTSFFYVWQRITALDVMFIAFVYLLLIISSLRYYDYSEYFKSLMIGFTYCAGAYLSVRALKNVELLQKNLRHMSPIITVAAIVLFNRGIGEKSYSMYLGYLVLPAAIISGSVFFNMFDISKKERIVHIINYAVATIMCLLSGVRGPLLCIAVFSALQILFFEYEKKRKITYIMIIVLATFLLYKHRDVLMMDLSVYAFDKNLSTRIFDKFFNGELFFDSGRSSYIKSGMDALNSSLTSALFGVGVGGDRIQIARALGINNVIGSYPHNLFVEILVQFGYIFGVILCVLLIILSTVAIKRSKNQTSGNILWIFFAIGILPLMFSDSYITEPFFFCYLAMCVNVISGTYEDNKAEQLGVKKELQKQ